MGLGVCRGCRRHARGERCPFCGGELAAPVPRPRISRASRRGLALAATAIAAACGGTTSEPRDASPDNISIAAYGIPVDASPSDARFDGPVAAYGGPPDAGFDASEAGDAGPKDASDGG
jgi:hypothetical protein